MREMTFDVYLRCGDRIEASIGEVTVPAIVTTGQVEGDVLPFSIAADMPAFRRNLAALLPRSCRNDRAARLLISRFVCCSPPELTRHEPGPTPSPP